MKSFDYFFPPSSLPPHPSPSPCLLPHSHLPHPSRLSLPPSSHNRYITVLVEMTRFDSTHQGHLIAGQMLDVTIRVRDVRPFAIKQMVLLSLRLSCHNSTILCTSHYRQPSWRTLTSSLGTPRITGYVRYSMLLPGLLGSTVHFSPTRGRQLMLC